mmetsp:Transcript_3849/g.8310  ORF Transcript_3849/g.8310 Transcript_3849/m.8310 type:complete len:598 (+) Transcript_3849:583-2376(+)
MAFMMLAVCTAEDDAPPPLCFVDDTKPLRMTALGFGLDASRFAASSRSTAASSSAAMSSTERMSRCMFSCTSFNAGLNSRVSFSPAFASSISSHALEIKLSNSLRKVSSDEFAAHNSLSRLRSWLLPSSSDSTFERTAVDELAMASISIFPSRPPLDDSKLFVTLVTSSNMALTSAMTFCMSFSIACNPSSDAAGFFPRISASFTPHEGSGELCKFTAGEFEVSIGLNFSAMIVVQSDLGLFVGVCSMSNSCSAVAAASMSISPTFTRCNNSIPLSIGDFGVLVLDLSVGFGGTVERGGVTSALTGVENAAEGVVGAAVGLKLNAGGAATGGAATGSLATSGVLGLHPNADAEATGGDTTGALAGSGALKLNAGVSAGLKLNAGVDATDVVATDVVSGGLKLNTGVEATAGVATSAGLKLNAGVEATGGVATSAGLKLKAGVDATGGVATSTGLKLNAGVDATGGVATSGAFAASAGVKLNAGEDAGSGVLKLNAGVEATVAGVLALGALNENAVVDATGVAGLKENAGGAATGGAATSGFDGGANENAGAAAEDAGGAKPNAGAAAGVAGALDAPAMAGCAPVGNVCCVFICDAPV